MKHSYTWSLLTLCAVYTPTYAEALPQPNYPSGWIVNTGIGATEFINTGSSQTTTASGTTSTINPRSFQFGGMGNIAVGYGNRFQNQGFFGGELGLNLFSTRKTAASSIAQNSTTVDDTFSTPITVTTNNRLSSKTTVSGNALVPFLDLKPGVLIGKNQLMFARLGISYNQINVQTQSNYHSEATRVTTDVNTLIGADSTLYQNSKKNLIGFRGGLGFEYLITDQLGISANYVYAFYNSIKTHATSTSNQVACDTYEGCHINNNGTYVNSGTSTIADQQAILQLIYHLS